MDRGPWTVDGAPWKEFNVGNDVRKRFHMVIGVDPRWPLNHRSVGAGKFREIIVTKICENDDTGGPWPLTIDNESWIMDGG